MNTKEVDLIDELFEKLDLVDEIDLDLVDEVELDQEDKILFSKELLERIRSEVKKEIASIPVGKLITRILRREAEKREKSNGLLKDSLSKDLDGLKEETKKTNEGLRGEFEEFKEKIRKKFDDLKNDFLSFDKKQWFQFGGFSPQFNDLNIGDPGTEGSWRIVITGSDLSVQRLESGNWVTKGAFNP